MNCIHQAIKWLNKSAYGLGALIIFMTIISAVPSLAQITPNVLYGFQGGQADVDQPQGPVAQGRDGNIYGIGTNGTSNFRGGVFKITPTGDETLLASFPSNFAAGGCLGLVLGLDGNFYGTCVNGGANNAGLFYRVTPAGVVTDLYDFPNLGSIVQGVAVLGENGDFYGVFGNNIYSITTAGVYKTLYTLTAASGNLWPSVLNAGGDGNFYGTVADADGFGNQGGIFGISSTGLFKLIYGFDSSSAVGSSPSIGVTMGRHGDLFGTTEEGGTNSNGTIYTVTTTGQKATALHNINAETEGANGTGGAGQDSLNLILEGADGNLYGANASGGLGNEGGIYQLTAKDAFSGFLFGSLNPPTAGTNPFGPLMQHTNGFVYGTTISNGPQGADGTFFYLDIGAAPFISLVTPVYSGAEGTVVEILGQGFTSKSVVKFGGVAATAMEQTGGTFIEAKIPTGALTGDITVTTGSTTLSTLSVYKIKPTLKSFTPSSGPVGTPVTIDGTGLTQASKVTFNGTTASFTVDSDSEITATVPAEATSGKIEITTKGGSAISSTRFTVN